VVALICSYKALVLGVRLSQARYSSDVNTLGEDGILPVYRHGQFALSATPLIALSIIVLIIRGLPLSRLMEGNSGADRAPSLSS